MLIFSVEARAAFVSWVREVYETQIIYRFFQTGGETSNDIVYRPTWIPSDYQITSEFISDGPSTIEYRDASNRIVVFAYYRNGSSPVFQMNQDGIGTYKQVSVNGVPAELYLDQNDGNANVLIWLDEDSGTVFRILASFNEDELIKMAESVEKNES